MIVTGVNHLLWFLLGVCVEYQSYQQTARTSSVLIILCLTLKGRKDIFFLLPVVLFIHLDCFHQDISKYNRTQFCSSSAAPQKYI